MATTNKKDKVLIADGANTSWFEQSAGFTASTSFTGFSLIAGSGSFTGTANIFGYNK